MVGQSCVIAAVSVWINSDFLIKVIVHFLVEMSDL